MFAKVFTQILDSSLAEDWQTRLVFEDLLKLCDPNGVVDMTHEAISRRTNVPLEIVKRGIAELEKPDARSRNPENSGRRIVRLDEHRDWGWAVLNYLHYRKIANEDQRREKTKARVSRFRQSSGKCNGPVTLGNADVTHSNAGNAKEKEKEKEKEEEKRERASARFSPPTLQEVQFEAEKIGLPKDEAEAFWHYYQSNGWKVGRVPMKDWRAALVRWKVRWESERKPTQTIRPDHSKGF